MTKHEARVALARVFAKDLLQNKYKEIVHAQYCYNMSCSVSECLKFYLKPFFESDDIEDVKVEELRSIDNFYPQLNVVIMPKRKPVYVDLDFSII